MSAVRHSRARSVVFLAALIPVLFLSCVGTSSTITLNADGSGTIIQEYRIARELEELGELDGNAGQPAVPVIEEDLRKTAARIPGLHLKSYTAREDGKDRVHRAEFAFDSPEALAAFFAANNEFFKVDFPGKRISVSFSAWNESEENERFREMMADELSGYTFDLSFSLPGTAAYTWLDGKGNVLAEQSAAPGACSVSGKTALFSASMAELVYLDEELTLEISW